MRRQKTWNKKFGHSTETLPPVLREMLMKPKILLATLLFAPLIAIACASPGNKHSRITPNDKRPQTAEVESGYKPVDDTDGASPSGRQSALGSTCCSGKYTCDAKGRIVRKPNGSGGFLDYVYHPESDKLILVLNDSFRTEFHYNEQGELARAENSDGLVIEFDYDEKEKISRIVEVNRADGTRRVLEFEYNMAGKPTEITLVGTGKITVDYDDKGEISKVDSKQGAKMALLVTQTFQNLLSVVQPTGTRF
jgi:YD repeat-containing protein